VRPPSSELPAAVCIAIGMVVKGNRESEVLLQHLPLTPQTRRGTSPRQALIHF
jgi:hypothetical protein